MFFYDRFIHIPANATGFTGIRCPVPEAITIVSASSHYHQRGTGMRVWNDEADSPAATPFFETDDWEHPVDFHGPLSVRAGSSLRVQCEYANDDSTEVFEGPNAKTSEMCVFGGLYYPRRTSSFDVCSPPSILGNGAEACSALTTCVKPCPAGDGPTGACWQRCISRGCTGAADALITLSGCAQQQCRSECSSGNCEPCLLERCTADFQACSAQKCGP